MQCPTCEQDIGPAMGQMIRHLRQEHNVDHHDAVNQARELRGTERESQQVHSGDTRRGEAGTPGRNRSSGNQNSRAEQLRSERGEGVQQRRGNRSEEEGEVHE